MKMKIVRELENKLETLEGRAYENARMTLEKIENRTRVNTWVLENNEGTYGTEIVITKEGHVDFYLCIMERYSSKISYIRVANFQQEFSCGDIFLPNGQYKEYQKLGNIINALNKMYNDLGFYFNNKNNRKTLECARKQYEINKFINEQETETEEIEISLDEKYAKQLEESPNHIITIKIFKEILANDDVFVGAYDVLADRFNPYYELGKIMHKKFKELLDATINGELGLGDMDILCTELFRTCGYEQFAKYDTEIKILDFKSRKKYPTYEWFMKENCWDGTRTIVDMEKIYDFEDAGLKVELFEDIEEVLIWNVTEQLEGQVGFNDMEIKEEVEEMKNKEVLDLNENLPLGTIVGFRYDVYENDVLVEKMILTGKIVHISDDFNGKYNVETNDKKTYLVYNSDIVTWERPSKKEIKISITGEGRVEDIETTSVADASKNLQRRIAETKGDRYCNKTWITIDIEEFDQPIEFRVDLIESLHGNIENVLKLIIEEKERECKYVSENRQSCTWIKDIDKFISVRKELIQVLEGYLLPEPKELELTEEEVEPMITTITKQQLTNRLKKLGNQLIDEKSKEEKEKIVYELLPKANELEVEIVNNTGKEINTKLMQDVIKKTENKKIFGDKVVMTYSDLNKVCFENDDISLRINLFGEYNFKDRKEIKIRWSLFETSKIEEIDEDFNCVYGESTTEGETIIVTPNEPTPDRKNTSDYRMLMQGNKAIDIVHINPYKSNRHRGGLVGSKIIKYSQGFFPNGEIQNKLTEEQIKELESCGLDIDKEVTIAKRIVEEFNELTDKNNKKMRTLRRVNRVGSDVCEYDIIFAGMNINGTKSYYKDGEPHEVIKGIDADRKIYISPEYEYLRPLIKKELERKEVNTNEQSNNSYGEEIKQLL